MTDQETLLQKMGKLLYAGMASDKYWDALDKRILALRAAFETARERLDGESLWALRGAAEKAYSFADGFYGEWQLPYTTLSKLKELVRSEEGEGDNDAS